MPFDNVPEKNFVFDTLLDLINTLNTSDPIASADQVLLPDFGWAFDVPEGATASVNLIAELTTDLSGFLPGSENVGSTIVTAPNDPVPNYKLTILGLANPSTDGFVTRTIPEPSTLLLIAPLGLMMLWLNRRRSHSNWI